MLFALRMLLISLVNGASGLPDVCCRDFQAAVSIPGTDLDKYSGIYTAISSPNDAQDLYPVYMKTDDASIFVAHTERDIPLNFSGYYMPQWHFANITAYENGYKNKSMEILFGTSLFSCPGFSNDALTGGVREVQYNSKDNEGQVQIEFSESGQGMIAFKCLTNCMGSVEGQTVEVPPGYQMFKTCPGGAGDKRGTSVCLQGGIWSDYFGCQEDNELAIGGCCKTMTLQLTAEEYPEFSRLYAGFLGIWTQSHEAHGKPVYTKLGHSGLYLANSNATDYAAPWTMWGGTDQVDSIHVGNIKLGPEEICCPENYGEIYFEERAGGLRPAHTSKVRLKCGAHSWMMAKE